LPKAFEASLDLPRSRPRHRCHTAPDLPAWSTKPPPPRRAHPGNVDAELAQLAGENAEIVFEGEIGAENVRAGLLHGQHDRREILALVGIALIENRRGAELFERRGQRLSARRPNASVE
jgi:hypothetical protein